LQATQVPAPLQIGVVPEHCVLVVHWTHICVVGLQAGTAELKGTVLQAQAMMTNANSIISQINAGQGTLGKLTKDETLYREMTLTMVNAREILEKVNKGQGSVPWPSRACPVSRISPTYGFFVAGSSAGLV